MVVVIVRWYIKEGQDEKFKKKWQGMEPKSKEGLFREFFSKPIISAEEKYHTLDVESKHYTTYLNIGVWKELSDFENAIGSLILGRFVNEKPEKKDVELIEIFDFEFKLRERIVMDVEKTRGGEWILPPIDF
jgi:hypothetical protein